MCVGLHVKCRYSCKILIKLEFSQQIFEKKIQLPNFMKIRSVGAWFFHADTNVLADAASSRFSKYCERSCLRVENLFLFKGEEFVPV